MAWDVNEVSIWGEQERERYQLCEAENETRDQKNHVHAEKGIKTMRTSTRTRRLKQIKLSLTF